MSIEKYSPPPIFVTGAPRSGTSMVAGLVRAAGAWAGHCQGPDEDNPRGYHENVGLRKLIKEEVRAAGGDPIGACPLTRWWQLEAEMLIERDHAGIMRERMQEQILAQGYQPGTPWMYKDARLLHIWPLMVSAFPDALWIICERAEEATLRSVAAFAPLAGKIPDPAAWLAYHRHAVRALSDHGGKGVVINTDRLVVCPSAKDLRGALLTHAGLYLTSKLISALIDPQIWNRLGRKDAKP